MSSTSDENRPARVVLMVIDGLRADTLDTQWMPSLNEVMGRSRRFGAHRGVFPSATRVSSASIATGCHPARHGLAGNAIAWDTGDGLEAVSVGPVGFRDKWREVTGHTLLTPTVAERVASHGGMVIHSNSSPGAAHMQDPEGHSRFLHRSGSWAPGFAAAQDTLSVAYDGTGDAVTAARFCQSLLYDPVCAVNLLWVCEPDHTQHAIALGSPDHRAILAGSDRLVAQVADAVERLRERGEDVLLIIASDHGQETADDVIDVDAALVEAGLKASLDSRDVVIASSGMGALIYFSDPTADNCARVAQWLASQPWCENAWHGNELAAIGQRPADGLGVAFAMARRDDPNEHGVRGFANVVKDPFSPGDCRGHGQHGGMGPYEGSPVLVIDGLQFAQGVHTQPTCLVDIAPTAMSHLGLEASDMDGRALQGE
jgi:hypothetical protein